MINVKVYNTRSSSVPIDEVENLYETCGWGRSEMIRCAIENSYSIVIAFINGEAVGFARLISDGVAYALLVDTMVDPDYRRRGVGTTIVKSLIKHCRDNKIFMLKLISSKEGKEFYKRIGFSTCSSEEPGMLLRL